MRPTGGAVISSIFNRASGQRKIFAAIEKLPRGPREGGRSVAWREALDFGECGRLE